MIIKRSASSRMVEQVTKEEKDGRTVYRMERNGYTIEAGVDHDDNEIYSCRVTSRPNEDFTKLSVTYKGSKAVATLNVSATGDLYPEELADFESEVNNAVDAVNYFTKELAKIK